jgi:predicted Fe-Mo cluster-binding NifX family protein
MIMERYLVASAGDTLEAKVSGRFGHSRCFIVINPQTMEFEVYPGVGKDDEFHGIGRFTNLGIKKVIVGNIGPTAYDQVTSSGYIVYLCRNMTVSEAIKKVENGDVPVLKEPTLQHSIHSSRKADNGNGGRREGRGRGKGLGLGPSDGRGRSKGQGKGMRKGGGRGKRSGD